VPSGVTVQITGPEISVTGKLGESHLALRENVEVTLDGSLVWVKPANETKHARMMWGTTRALINNMVKGVSEGFTQTRLPSRVTSTSSRKGRRDSPSLPVTLISGPEI
jgi:ribosomal protein L6P/L9E